MLKMKLNNHTMLCFVPVHLKPRKQKHFVRTDLRSRWRIFNWINFKSHHCSCLCGRVFPPRLNQKCCRLMFLPIKSHFIHADPIICMKADSPPGRNDSQLVPNDTSIWNTVCLWFMVGAGHMLCLFGAEDLMSGAGFVSWLNGKNVMLAWNAEVVEGPGNIVVEKHSLSQANLHIGSLQYSKCTVWLWWNCRFLTDTLLFDGSNVGYPWWWRDKNVCSN